MIYFYLKLNIVYNRENGAFTENKNLFSRSQNIN
jgi:hypothetical protein